jgi:NADPH:quinone reductase-like Zn-dependent oxidoreductase
MTMKAIVYTRYGSPDVLQLKEISQPAVRDDEVLVRVCAAALNPADWHLMRGLPYLARVVAGLRRPATPVVPGWDLAGRVEQAGRGVRLFRPGDEVFGRTRLAYRAAPGAEVATGSCAEYASVAEGLLVPKPGNLTFEQAAAVPLAGLTALQALRDAGRLRPGQQVLVNGASGGIGTFAVQIAKSFGAEVTGVCSTKNMDMVASIGADHVIDYTRHDFTLGGQRYDLILDTANRSLSDCRRALTPWGILVPVGGSGGRWIGPLARQYRARLLSPLVSQTLRKFHTTWNRQDLEFVRDLIEARKVRPVIDRTYPLSATAEAMRYLEVGHAPGKIVISVPG